MTDGCCQIPEARCRRRRRATLVEGPSAAVYTSGHSLEIAPKNSHFFSLFGPPGVIPTCRDSISKSFHAKQIGPDTWSSRASKTPCGTSNPKVSYRFPLIVHYLRAWTRTLDRGRRREQESQNPSGPGDRAGRVDHRVVRRNEVPCARRCGGYGTRRSAARSRRGGARLGEPRFARIEPRAVSCLRMNKSEANYDHQQPNGARER